VPDAAESREQNNQSETRRRSGFVSVRGSSVCQAAGLSDARYVFGTANPTKSYRVRVAVDFDAHRKVTRILVRGLRFPAMRGITEPIVYTSDSDYWRGFALHA
jgi:hypothetical protein